MAKFYQCSYCDFSFRSDEERKRHEHICSKNGKTEEERFKERQQLKKKER